MCRSRRWRSRSRLSKSPTARRKRCVAAGCTGRTPGATKHARVMCHALLAQALLRVSLWAIGVQAVLDAYLCLFHMSTGMILGMDGRMTFRTLPFLANRAATASSLVADPARRGLFGVHAGRLPPVCAVFPRGDAVPAPHMARVAAGAAGQRRAAPRARHAAHHLLCVPAAPTAASAAAAPWLNVLRPALPCPGGGRRRCHADWHHPVLRGQRRSGALDRRRDALVLASPDCAQCLRQRPAPSVAVRKAKGQPGGRTARGC